jgi:hypothetical protein
VLRDKITEIFVSIVGFCEDIASEKNTAGACATFRGENARCSNVSDFEPICKLVYKLLLLYIRVVANYRHSRSKSETFEQRNTSESGVDKNLNFFRTRQFIEEEFSD